MKALLDRTAIVVIDCSTESGLCAGAMEHLQHCLLACEQQELLGVKVLGMPLPPHRQRARAAG